MSTPRPSVLVHLSDKPVNNNLTYLRWFKRNIILNLMSLFHTLTGSNSEYGWGTDNRPVGLICGSDLVYPFSCRGCLFRPTRKTYRFCSTNSPICGLFVPQIVRPFSVSTGGVNSRVRKVVWSRDQIHLLGYFETPSKNWIINHGTERRINKFLQIYRSSVRQVKRGVSKYGSTTVRRKVSLLDYSFV